MPTQEELLREKHRNNLELKVSKKEQKLLKKGYPVQRIIGFCEMQNVRIFLNRFVLIPRYETEELILEAYNHINKDSTVLDLGTGSGFIAIAIQKNKKCCVDAVEKNFFALKQAEKNSFFNETKINFIRSDWFKKVTKKYDVIISNPPYLNYQEVINKPKFDPKYALYAKDSGLRDYLKILKKAHLFLNKNGVLIFEIDDFVAPFFEKNYPESNIIKDINGKKRIVVITKQELENLAL
ncbi:peptide chain release factor N(5)-glutamine methyltransferase [Mycoplasma sp. 4044]